MGDVIDIGKHLIGFVLAGPLAVHVESPHNIVDAGIR